jgi:hypothetical protein
MTSMMKLHLDQFLWFLMKMQISIHQMMRCSNQISTSDDQRDQLLRSDDQLFVRFEKAKISFRDSIKRGITHSFQWITIYVFIQDWSPCQIPIFAKSKQVVVASGIYFSPERSDSFINIRSSLHDFWIPHWSDKCISSIHRKPETTSGNLAKTWIVQTFYNIFGLSQFPFDYVWVIFWFACQLCEVNSTWSRAFASCIPKDSKSFINTSFII